jgi:hypothetical protein
MREQAPPGSESDPETPGQQLLFAHTLTGARATWATLRTLDVVAAQPLCPIIPATWHNRSSLTWLRQETLGTEIRYVSASFDDELRQRQPGDFG